MSHQPTTLPTPKIGDLGTLLYPQDRMPVQVVRVSPSGCKITFRDIDTRDLPITRVDGPWPVLSHTVTEPVAPEQLQGLERDAWRDSRGRYHTPSGVEVMIGQAYAYRNFGD